MTEAHPDPETILGPHPEPHDHGQLLQHLTFVARRYACGHTVVEQGHLDMTSRRMVWDRHLEELPEADGIRPALTLVATIVQNEMDEIATPLW